MGDNNLRPFSKKSRIRFSSLTYGAIFVERDLSFVLQHSNEN